MPPTEPVAPTRRRYLVELDVLRAVTFVGVVAQHAVLWPVPPSSIGGFGAVMLLHFTRNAFFFASALVLCHSWLRAAGPGRSPGTGRAPAGWWWRFWRRRVATVLVPYLVWTVAYSLYSIATTSGGAALWPVLRHNLVNGYYQLYFVVVLVQLYVVLPLLVALLRRTVGHHGVVLAVSAAVQLILDGLQHSVHGSAGVAGTAHAVAVSALASRYLPAYQLFVVAGALTVWHLDTVFTVIDRHWRRLLVAVAVVGLAAEGRYLAAALTAGHPGRASDLNQPIAVVWFLAAIVGLLVAGRRFASGGGARRRRLVTWASDVSGGFYYAHVLFLQLVLWGLTASGLRAEVPWYVTTALLLPGTLVATGLFVAMVRRTPARVALTGPDRSRQRRRRAMEAPVVRPALQPS